MPRSGNPPGNVFFGNFKARFVSNQREKQKNMLYEILFQEKEKIINLPSK